MTVRTNRQEIREAIQASGRTQEDAAAAIGISPVTLSRWLNGHADPGFDKLESLAVAIGQSIVLTFGPDTTKQPPEPAWVERLLAGTMALEARNEISETELQRAEAAAAAYLAVARQRRLRPGGDDDAAEGVA